VVPGAAVRPLLPIALAAALAPSRGSAHDLWVERAGDAFALRSGHRGAAPLPIDAAKVRGVSCVEGGRAQDVRGATAFAANEARIPGPCEVVSVFYDGGTWSLTPDGERNLPRSRVPDAVRAWVSHQYAKWVDLGAAAAAEPTGAELELVPARTARPRVGDKVTVRVLSAGKPVADAVVSVGHKALGETDGRGEARLRVRTPVETFSATVRRPLSSPDAETLVLEASLTFEAAP
jgi:uncharacterized GH25 family protein